MTTKYSYPLNAKTAITYSFLISLFWCSLMIIGGLLKGSHGDTPDFEMTFVITRMLWFFATKTITLFLLFMFGFAVFKKQWSGRKKYFLSITGIILLTFIIVFFIFIIEQIIFHTPAFPPKFYLILTFLSTLITSSIVLITTLMLYVSSQKEIEQTEKQNLITENIRNRYEALKNQIDPHFLFNSLNTLNGLIGQDDAKAHEYVYKLSSVFRYTIHNKEITTLKEELGFTESFCYLMKIRYGDSLQIAYRIDNNYLDCQIMPLSLQLLIENAIKHNVTSNKRPLTITVETTDNNSVIVFNRIQPKSESSAGAGVGLANLTERYKLLFQKEVGISNANDIFRVEVPLIKSKK